MIKAGTTLRLRSQAGEESTVTVLEAIEPKDPTPARLSQRDPRWAGKRLGLTDGPETIGSHGCLLTCMTRALGRSDVGALNDELVSRRMFAPNSGNVFWDLAPFGLHNVAISGLFDRREMPAEWMVRLISHVRAGKPAILGVDFNPWPSNAVYDEHYVFVTGIDNGGVLVPDEIAIADPWPLPDEPAPPTHLTPRYGPNQAFAACRVLLYERT